MIDCEWVIDDKGTSDATKWRICSRASSFTITLKGSESASNLFNACWQHVKKYRRRKFVEDSFGKGAKVEIVDIGKQKRKIDPKKHLRTFGMDE